MKKNKKPLAKPIKASEPKHERVIITNPCVFCGEEVPEGDHVCWICNHPDGRR